MDTERVAAQAKWRFEVGRRTMLMQALNSSAAYSASNGAGDNGSGSGSPITAFIGQLASSIASCDALLSSILHFSDQQAQIELIQHQHWASALGIALRKLKRAYESQEQELKRTQARVQTLEDELEEAWREAEKMAIEFDDLEQEVAESSTEDELQGVDMHDGGVDAEDTHPRLEARQDPDETGTLCDATINTDVAVVVGVTATAVASKATLVSSPAKPKFTDKSDAKSIRSVKSTRSRRSTREGPGHVSRVSAARTRSRAASNASLRLPKALRSVPSTPVDALPVDVPPIPALPQDNSFLDMGNLAQEQAHEALSPPLPPPRSCRLSSFLYTCSHVIIVQATPTRRSPFPPHPTRQASHRPASRPSGSKQTAATAPVSTASIGHIHSRSFPPSCLERQERHDGATS